MDLSGSVALQTQVGEFVNDRVELGWLALYLPVTGFLFFRIVRGFRAERYAEKALGADITTVRDSVIAQKIIPTLAKVTSTVRTYMKDFEEVEHLPGEPGDPQVEAERVLGYRAASFSAPLQDLGRQYSTVSMVDGSHDRKVGECRRSAWAFAVLLVCWTYLACAVAITDNDLPAWSLYTAVAIACIALGWAAAEWWLGNQDTNELSRKVRAARASQVGGTN